MKTAMMNQKRGPTDTIMLPCNWRSLQGLTDMVCCLATEDSCRDSQIQLCCQATGDACRNSQIWYAAGQLVMPAGTHRYDMLPGNWRSLQGLTDTVMLPCNLRFLQGLTDMVCCRATCHACRDSQIQYAAWQLEIPAGTHRYDMLLGKW